MDRVLTSGSVGDVLVNTLAWNAMAVDSIPVLSDIFVIFITAMNEMLPTEKIYHLSLFNIVHVFQWTTPYSDHCCPDIIAVLSLREMREITVCTSVEKLSA